MQRVKMLWRTPLLLPKDAREGKSTSDTKLCEHPHAHCIIPSRIKKKCHVDFPTWKRQWRRQPDRKKRGQAGSQGTWARVPARRGLAGWPRVPWTSPPCPHREVARLSSHPVFTTLVGPEARMACASSSKTRCSPRGGFDFPRMSLSSCTGRLLERQALSNFPALS